MVQFAYTILYVREVTASLSFYENAFGFTRKFLAPGNEYGELSTGNTTLSFASFNMANSNIPGGFIESNNTNKPFAVEIAFTTDDVEKTVQSALQHGATLEAPAKAKPWGQTVAYVRDIDGFLIEICTPV